MLLTLTCCKHISYAYIHSHTRTHRLAFDIRGEGTLPRVTIKEPKLRNANGHAKASFSKLLVGKSQTLPLVVCNSGILPATVRFGQRIGEWPPAENPKDWKEGPKCFHFDGRGAELFLQPGEERSYTVSFRPKAVGPEGTETFVGAVEMIVHSNEYERNLIELEGKAYTQDMSFENMPSGAEDSIGFGNIPVGVQKTMNFTLSNNSENVYRFVWEQDPAGLLTFSPAVGHIHPHETKEITVTVFAADRVTIEAQELPLKMQQIVYADDAVDWDDSMKEVEWITDDAAFGNESAPAHNATEESEIASPPPFSRSGRARKNKPKKITRVKPEPAYNAVLVGEPPEEGAEDERQPKEDTMVLKVSVSADYLKYAFVVKDPESGEDADAEEPPSALNFAETMMYRTRQHSFRFKNVSQAAMEVSWRVCTMDGEEDFESDAPFFVDRESTTLPPNESCEVSIRFAPTEVDTYRRKVVGMIKNLDTRVPKPVKILTEEEEAEPAEESESEPPPAPQPQPEIMLLGKSARPLCHFEILESDWLTGGRRPPNQTTPSGVSVDPNSHCVEFESLGTQVRNTKRFYVMNPTNMNYKFKWECDDGTGAAVAHLAKAFKCVHKEGFVLSGKKAEMVFEYTPDSDQILESVWRFEIPEHNLSVPFLLVGHVKEPRVYFDRTYCNFQSLLLNHKATQTVKLVNKEHLPFAFAFNGRTFGADEVPPVVKITPSQGTVGPESEMELEVCFCDCACMCVAYVCV